MSEIKLIPTTTNILKVGSNIEIQTTYSDDDYEQIFIAEVVGAVDTVNYREGDEVMVSSVPNLDAIINSDGDLILIADDSSGYAIDSNGDLIHTF